jgi:putative FmdB family regulatory protein
MPIYEYQCSDCGHTIDELQSMSEPPLLKCPKCGKDTLKRLIGTGGGLIFKGSGFYLTDYKNSKSTDKSKTSPKKETEKTDSKPASKTSSEHKSSENKSGETKSGDTKSGESKSTETKSSSKTNSGKN